MVTNEIKQTNMITNEEVLERISEGRALWNSIKQKEIMD